MFVTYAGGELIWFLLLLLITIDFDYSKSLFALRRTAFALSFWVPANQMQLCRSIVWMLNGKSRKQEWAEVVWIIYDRPLIITHRAVLWLIDFKPIGEGGVRLAGQPDQNEKSKCGYHCVFRKLEGQFGGNSCLWYNSWPPLYSWYF